MSTEGFAGKKLWSPQVILVTTQADLAGNDDLESGVHSDPEGLLTEMRKRYESDFVIEPHMYVVDSVKTSSEQMTRLKGALAEVKKFICGVRVFYRLHY